MAQYDDNSRISGVSLGTASRTNAIDYRKQYNDMMAKLNLSQKPKNSVFDGFAASNSVQKACTDFNG